MPYSVFLESAEVFHSKVLNCANRSELFISDELRAHNTEIWVRDEI